MTVWDHVLAVAFCIGLSVLGHLQHRASRGAEPAVFTPREKLLTYWSNSLQLTIVGALTLVVWKLGGRSLHELGPATRREVGHSLAMVAAAALWEEIVFRGFLIPYVASFTGTTTVGLALAVAIPGVIFGMLHLYQGVRSAVSIVLGAICFGAILVVTGSLWIPMALHFVIDLIGSLLGPWLAGGPGAEPDSK